MRSTSVPYEAIAVQLYPDFNNNTSSHCRDMRGSGVEMAYPNILSVVCLAHVGNRELVLLHLGTGRGISQDFPVALSTGT